MRDDIEELALQYSCEYCVARPGVWCRTLKGAAATGLHSIRLHPLMSAFGLGYVEAEQQYRKPVGVVPEWEERRAR